jgi:hypothetical protein
LAVQDDTAAINEAKINVFNIFFIVTFIRI